MFPFTPIVMPHDRDKRFLYAIRRLKKRQQYTQLAPPSSVDEAPSTGGSSISGPDVSVDNAVVRWDGTDGDRIQSSSVYILDTGRIGNKVTPAKAVDFVSKGAGDGIRLRNLPDTQDRFHVFTVGGGNGPARLQLRDGSGNLDVELLADGESYVDGGNFHIKTPNRLKGGVTYSISYEQITQATIDFILALRAWRDETVNPPYVNQVDCCRTITATCANADLMTNMTGTITINGIDADGATIADVITVNAPPGLPVTYATDYAFFEITSIVVDQTDSHLADQYSIGVADEWGVPYPLNAAGDVFKATINGTHDIVSSVNATYGTFILTTASATGDTIVAHLRPFR